MQKIQFMAFYNKFLVYVLIFHKYFYIIPRGLMARIPGFHPGGPGSIPHVGEHFFSPFFRFFRKFLYFWGNFQPETDITQQPTAAMPPVYSHPFIELSMPYKGGVAQMAKSFTFLHFI